MFEGEASYTANAPEDIQPSESAQEQPEVNQSEAPEGTDSSLETLNPSTENQHPKGYVPLAALHEARDQLKSLKESQDWRAYQELKTRLETDPNYSYYLSQVASLYDPSKVNDLVHGLNQLRQQGKPDPYANYPQEIAEPLRKTQMLEQTVQQLLIQNQNQQQQSNYNQYVNRLSEKLSESKIPEHWKGYYQEKAVELGAKLNPNALSSYDARLVDQVFSQIHQQVQQIQRAERGSYVSDKSRDVTPASTSSTGVAPRINQQKLKTSEDRIGMVAELLRAST